MDRAEGRNLISTGETRKRKGAEQMLGANNQGVEEDQTGAPEPPPQLADVLRINIMQVV
jgi:hypothetical protein